MAKSPTCTIIAGPNGAGKTTFALDYLPGIGCNNFVNADLIAAGLSPFAPERERIAAARLFLREIQTYREKKEDFAFETTLSGKAYLRLIRNLQAEGWQVTLIYLFLPDVEFSLDRVKERVAHGGHNIPEADIRRRFPRSLYNLVTLYGQLCNKTYCLNNLLKKPSLVFSQDKNGLEVHDQSTYNTLLERSRI